jgi:hypothetical protein
MCVRGAQVSDPTTMRRHAMAQLLNTFMSLRDGSVDNDGQGGAAAAEAGQEEEEAVEEDETEARQQAADTVLLAEAGQDQLTDQRTDVQVEAEADVDLVSSDDDGEMDVDLEMILGTVSDMLERRAGQGVSHPTPPAHTRFASHWWYSVPHGTLTGHGSFRAE